MNIYIICRGEPAIESRTLKFEVNTIGSFVHNKWQIMKIKQVTCSYVTLINACTLRNPLNVADFILLYIDSPPAHTADRFYKPHKEDRSPIPVTDWSFMTHWSEFRVTKDHLCCINAVNVVWKIIQELHLRAPSSRTAKFFPFCVYMLWPVFFL